MNIHWNFEPFLWPWSWQQQSKSNFFTRQSSLWWWATNTKFSCKRSSTSEDITKAIFWLSYAVILTLKTTANKSFWKTIWLMMMRHDTKFGGKRFRNSEDIVWTDNSLTFWNFAVTLTLKTAIQFLHKTLWLMIMYFQTKFGSKRMSSSEDTVS